MFLRHTAPIGPFSDQDHLHQILVKHARAAHVPVGEKRRHGMHSLRHTLATRLLEDGTPVEQIADILGHQSVASTGVYLKSSLGLLAKCALDPDAPARGGVTMSAGITLADAITALVAEKRAVGYKYDAEARVLARFEAFCRREFPGLDTLTEASVQAWIAAARRRGVKPATLQGLAAPVRELARWLGRRGVPAYVLPAGGAAQARPVRPAHLHRPANWRRCSPRPTAATTAREVPLPAPGHAGAVPHDLRLRPALPPRPGCCASPTSTSTPACCRSATPKAARTGRCPSATPLRDRLAGYHAQVAGRPDRRTGSSPAAGPASR